MEQYVSVMNAVEQHNGRKLQRMLKMAVQRRPQGECARCDE